MTKLYVRKDKFGTYYFKDPEMTIPHREDGPAIEFVNGNKLWCQNGELHRLDGPAVEYADGDKSWYQNGELHRLDGPAIEHTDGTKCYYYEGEKFSSIKTNEQWKKHLKWMKFS